jgi:hypothetical protein
VEGTTEISTEVSARSRLWQKRFRGGHLGGISCSRQEHQEGKNRLLYIIWPSNRKYALVYVLEDKPMPYLFCLQIGEGKQATL